MGLLNDQPENVRRVLENVIATFSKVLAPSFKSIILFGSAAEGRLRPASDVNLMVVLENCAPEILARLQPDLEFAATAIRLNVMFIDVAELDAAMEAFAMKFADIIRRHRLLAGSDVLYGKQVPRTAALRQTRQVLLNLTLRLRERCARSGEKPEIALAAVRNAIGPLRTSAAQVLELQGRAVPSPKEALVQFVGGCGRESLAYLPDYFSQLREHAAPLTPSPQRVLANTLELVQAMHAQTGLIA